MGNESDEAQQKDMAGRSEIASGSAGLPVSMTCR